MAETVAPWSLTIASDLRLLGMARGFVESVCQAAGFDENVTHLIVLAADEAVNNIIRHAQAKTLVVALEQAADGSVCITTRDDGRGGRFVEGRGLSGMRERFGSLGGNLTITSLPGQGFSIRGAIPAAGAFL